jgi:hypothetical protein
VAEKELEAKFELQKSLQNGIPHRKTDSQSGTYDVNKCNESRLHRPGTDGKSHGYEFNQQGEVVI